MFLTCAPGRIGATRDDLQPYFSGACPGSAAPRQPASPGLLACFPAKAGHNSLAPHSRPAAVRRPFDAAGPTRRRGHDRQGIAGIVAGFGMIGPHRDGFPVVLNRFPRLPEACRFDGEAVIHEGASGLDADELPVPGARFIGESPRRFLASSGRSGCPARPRRQG